MRIDEEVLVPYPRRALGRALKPFPAAVARNGSHDEQNHAAHHVGNKKLNNLSVGRLYSVQLAGDGGIV
jgi:hypothetical protein